MVLSQTQALSRGLGSSVFRARFLCCQSRECPRDFRYSLDGGAALLRGAIYRRAIRALLGDPVAYRIGVGEVGQLDAR